MLINNKNYRRVTVLIGTMFQEGHFERQYLLRVNPFEPCPQQLLQHNNL